MFYIRWTRRDWAILLALTALAAALRFYQLGSVPPGFQFDEAFNALDAANVLDGQRPLFLPRNGGREVVYTYLQAALASVLGLRIYTLRLTSALAGVVAVPACYILLRMLFCRDSRRVAAFTSLVLAISFWHLHFSHYGIRVILMPVIFSGVCGFFWLGWRTGQWWPYLLSGILTGLSLWTHPTGRLIPFVLVGFTVWLLWEHPSARPSLSRLLVSPKLGWHTSQEDRPRTPLSGRTSPVGGLLLAGATALLVFLPLGVEFYRHPEFFLGHASAVSVLAERVSQGSPILALLRNGLAVAGMFSWQGDRAWIHNLAGRPVFDLLLSIPFWLGMIIWVRRLFRRDDPDRDALALLMLWSLVMLLPTILSDDAPNFSRSLPVLPALFVAAGLGLAAIVAVLPGSLNVLGHQFRLGSIVTALILMVSLGLTLRDYFVRFPQRAEAYYAYDVDKLDTWTQLEALSQEGQVYLSQLWAEHATLEFLRRGSSIKSFDSSDTVVLPAPGRAAAYVFPAEQAKRAAQLASLWLPARPDQSAQAAGIAPTVQRVADRYGRPLLEIVKVSADALNDWPERLRPAQTLDVPFANGPTLAGLRAEPGDIVLFWRATAPMRQSLTTFLHLVDAAGRRVGQSDKLPGNGSYPTTVWSEGERIIERYHPALEACLDDRPVRALVGWYDLAAGGARVSRADGAGDIVLAGELALPLTSRPPAQVQPTQVVDQPLVGGLSLIGYDVDGEELQAGSPLSLGLYWRAERPDAEQKVNVNLRALPQPAPAPDPSLESRQGGRVSSYTLWQGPLMPASTQWHPGEVVCRRLLLHLPSDVAKGPYRLEAEVAGQTIALSDLNVGESTRRFDAPPTARPLKIDLGEKVRLLGVDLAPPLSSGQPLTVTLVWQGLAPMQASYSVFVHLVDEAGNIVAQSDAVPVAIGTGQVLGDRNKPVSYPTDRWMPGEVVVDVHTLQIGDNPSVYRLYAGMYDPVSGERLPARDEAQKTVPDNAIPLGEVSVWPQK